MRAVRSPVIDLSGGGVLREPGEGDGCTGDGPSSKGAYVRGPGRLSRRR
ncbi:hypothetical protein ABZ747_19865 [Kitasatospora cineracea]